MCNLLQNGKSVTAKTWHCYSTKTTWIERFITSSIQMILIDNVDFSIESFHLIFSLPFSLFVSLSLGVFVFTCCQRKTMSFVHSITIAREAQNIKKCMQMQPEESQYSGNLSPHSIEHSTLDNKWTTLLRATHHSMASCTHTQRKKLILIC